MNYCAIELYLNRLCTAYSLRTREITQRSKAGGIDERERVGEATARFSDMILPRCP